ncbi:phage tail tube protein [Paenibacillus nasutitermitis]|uniref:Phage portal protein n=1 Tax=Paenibacillus nasutitermitis TaxID=1652958 RepID=A0A917E245_9BACL|nr:phage tail tube protein [Paenibacillus nasutitermitis]GGD95144.1 phage portal protein [Paenibacillus nasutitermitis]
MAFLNAGDTINGKTARAYITVNGVVEELFYAKTLEATVEKNKSDVPILGKRQVAHKASGWTGSGTLTIYYMTSFFRSLMMKYITDGIDTYFDLHVTNEDPASTVGSQTVVLKQCNMDSVIMAKFDISSDDALEEEVAFTFDDVEVSTAFNNPTV